MVLLLPRDQTNQATVEKLPQLPMSAMLLQLDAAESLVAEPQDDIEDVAHPGCVAALVSGMGDASPQPGQDPISFLECSGVLSTVRAYLGRGQRTFDLASATPAVMLESLERGRIAEVMIQDHHKPKRMTFLDWNLDRCHLRSLWDYWSSDLYEFTQFDARNKDKLFQQGFLAEHPTPASRLQDWIDIPMKRFFALRGLEDMFHSPNACALPPCQGDIHAGGRWVYCKKIDVDEECT